MRALGESLKVLKLHIVCQWLISLPLLALLIYLQAPLLIVFSITLLEECVKTWFFRAYLLQKIEKFSLMKSQESAHIGIIGECMIELVHLQQNQLQQKFGGDTLNMAVYLKRVAGDEVGVHYVTLLGDDQISDVMIESWQAEYLDDVLNVCRRCTVSI